MSIFVLVNESSQYLCYKPTVGYFFEELKTLIEEDFPKGLIRYKEKNKANCLGRAMKLKTKKINLTQKQ
jgi:hypothetical protein